MEYLSGVGKESLNKGVERYFLVDTSLPKFGLPYVSDENLGDASEYLSKLEEDEPGENPDDFHTYFRCKKFLKRISSNKSDSETERVDGDEAEAEEPEAKRHDMEYVPALRLLMQIAEEERLDIPESAFKYPPLEQAGLGEFVFARVA